MGQSAEPAMRLPSTVIPVELKRIGASPTAPERPSTSFDVEGTVTSPSTTPGEERTRIDLPAGRVTAAPATGSAPSGQVAGSSHNSSPAASCGQMASTATRSESPRVMRIGAPAGREAGDGRGRRTPRRRRG
eukprot:scaffold90394_cov24-Tisochrysis_lutea.AAC.6